MGACRAAGKTGSAVEVGGGLAGETSVGSELTSGAGGITGIALLVEGVGKLSGETEGDADVVGEVQKIGGGAGSAVGARRDALGTVGIAGSTGGRHKEKADSTGAGAAA